MFGHPCCCRPDLVLLLEIDALRFERAVIDTRVDVEFGQPRIGLLGTLFSPFLQQIGAVSVAILLAEPARIHLARSGVRWDPERLPETMRLVDKPGKQA